MAVVLGGLATSFLAAPTLAQDAPKPAEGAEAKPPGDAPAPPSAANEDPDVAPSPVGGLERMPAEAFWPPPYNRGLVGGSVWGAGMHGLQWPYYRKTGIGISGSVWIDNAYEEVTRGDAAEGNDRAWIQDARLVLRVTPTYTRGNWFVQAQAEFVANKNQKEKQPEVADADDLWVRVGYWNLLDVQIGRYQGWEVYHLGMALDLDTVERKGATDTNHPPPSIYGVTYGYERPSGMGNVGVHYYPFKFLRAELLGQLGSELGRNTLAGRPVIVLDLGWLKLKAGADYRRQSQVLSTLKEKFFFRGGGAGLILVFQPWVEGGFSFARGLVDHTDTNGETDAAGSYTVISWGGFLNVRPFEDALIGVGYHVTTKEDLKFEEGMNGMPGRVGEFDHKQSFAALQYVFGKQLWVKAVFAYASAHLAATGGNLTYTNTMYSARLRVQYLF